MRCARTVSICKPRKDDSQSSCWCQKISGSRFVEKRYQSRCKRLRQLVRTVFVYLEDESPAVREQQSIEVDQSYVYLIRIPICHAYTSPLT